MSALLDDSALYADIARGLLNSACFCSNFKPQPVFDLIQKTASELGGKITDEEMFKTFNMGWGFAIIVDKKDRDKTLSILEKTKTKAEEIGKITSTQSVEIQTDKRRLF
jgi:phosphoribosylformylglycinamidine cyclo-ligase